MSRDSKDQRHIRQDYHRLLQSRQWRDFSFDFIERNGGGCWACGDEDHLQVHHLVYRDVLPWEYYDHELRVLCEDCHKSVHAVADLVWVQILRFEPHELELILKRLQRLDEPDSTKVHSIVKGLFDRLIINK